MTVRPFDMPYVRPIDADRLALLSEVSQPSRYIGGEPGAVRKPWDAVDVRMALVFPDTYEIGISNMGLQILYRIVNGRTDALAERAFAPWMDYEKALRDRGLPLASLESKTPLGRFDILGIAIPYELTYTNILNVIDLAGVPLRTARREAHHPVVIGGGAAVHNPEPLAPFFDAFVIGDGEEVIHELLDVVKAWRRGGGDRPSLHAALAQISGVYVPSLYTVHHMPDGRVAAIEAHGGAPERVIRRVVADLDGAFYPTDPIMPVAKAIFDRVNVEVTRGCTHGCRFCQAGFTYRPVRERSPERVKQLVLESLQKTGCSQVSLSSLSTGDYLSLYPVLKELVDETESRKISYSLPSLRIGTLTPAVVRQIKRVSKTGFTMAPEAGTERLRQVINKPISEADLLAAVKNVFTEGWREIKFYFMYGLPTETREDLDGIVDLATRALAVGRSLGGPFRDVKVSTSNYVPKPMTPFQWLGQMPLAELDERRRYLKDRLSRVRGAKFTWTDERISELEAVFSRGDRRLADAVEMAFKRGLRMDSWSEMENPAAWNEIFSRLGIDPRFYAGREIPTDEVLPWDMIDCGTSKEYFTEDLARAGRERIIRDCRYGLCGDCGVCTAAASGPEVVPRVYVPEGGRATEFDLPMAENTVNHPLVPEVSAGETDTRGGGIPEGRFRYRIGWAKLGEFAMLSHLEMMALFIRAFRRAGLPLAHTEGKRPRPKLSFGPALSVGVESVAEVMDVTLIRQGVPAELMARLNEMLPDEATVTGVVALTGQDRSLTLDDLGYAYQLRWQDGIPDDLAARVKQVMGKSEILITRVDKKGREKVLDIRPLIGRLEMTDDCLELFFQADGNRVPRVSELIDIMGFTPGDPSIRTRRTGLYFLAGDRYASLLDARKAGPHFLTMDGEQESCLRKF